MKSKGMAYLFWILSFFGCLGFHRFYIGKTGTGIIWLLTGGIFGIGAFIDLFTLGGMVEFYNIKKSLELAMALQKKLSNAQMKKAGYKKY